MNIIAVNIQNRVFSESVLMMLRQSSDLKPICVPARDTEEILIECESVKPDVLLLDVTPRFSGTALEGRLELAARLKQTLPRCKTAFLCDEVAYPELAHEVMRAKQEGKIDAFFYTSITAEYLTASLNAM